MTTDHVTQVLLFPGGPRPHPVTGGAKGEGQLPRAQKARWHRTAVPKIFEGRNINDSVYFRDLCREKNLGRISLFLPPGALNPSCALLLLTDNETKRWTRICHDELFTEGHSLSPSSFSCYDLGLHARLHSVVEHSNSGKKVSIRFDSAI